ncbi:P-loop containing nucleoside triphosphate hydrolase protein [Amylostereum chailletii]|nr:P-loop containing nucleoside triphosphate hydrolase protein [Amylostereum chailletii]
MDKLKEILGTLNPQQRQSVESPPDGPLQILAGPGSGKTKVLTSRIAHLILVNTIPPWNICAVTFTNKAANEMKERLHKLIGQRSTKQLQMGTFHALCAKFLRKHGGLVSLEENFTICDADERFAVKSLREV